MINKSRNHYRITSLIPRMILILAFLVPLFFSLSKAFFPEGVFTLSLVKEAFTSEYNMRLLTFTVKESLYSAILSVLIALPGAYFYSNYTFRGKKLILSLSQLCFVLPSILVVLGFVIFYGNNGFLNRMLMSLLNSDTPVVKILYSFKAIILAHAFLNFPVALSLLTGYWSSLSKTPENAAATLGAGKLRIFFTITLGRILPVLLSAALLIFLYCFTSFSIILVLGGGPEYTTLEVEIYRTNNIMGQSAKASSLALYALFFNMILVLIYTLLSKHTRPDDRIGEDRAVKPKTLTHVLIIIIFSCIYQKIIV
ncbi:MAG: ABC transporter permease, partial [Bullifex sp.]